MVVVKQFCSHRNETKVLEKIKSNYINSVHLSNCYDYSLLPNIFTCDLWQSIALLVARLVAVMLVMKLFLHG